ncbi:hypothetical protein GJU39_10840 [Pedobacter petrophilus]|uniref:Uncharacterized protein n=1 Tax=Pedobacter petrophilus TaxID=1908241 RepID=A0A7K0FYC4_9SPHI|nr:hypothetical protein [Pedobacter petrophilus]MRX76588.1 hypothetical protein [Pedobacter petrophilus]
MQTNKSKNRNTQFPDQVVAVNEFQKLIEAYFEMNSLSEVNRILTEMLSASTGPDPRSGKHHPITIANTLYKVNNIINLFTKAKPLANKASFRHSVKNQPYNLQAVGHFDIAQLSELLHYGLSAFIFQEEGFEGATLNFSAEIIPAYKMIYDWFTDCDAWYTAVKRNESGRIVSNEIN